MGRLIIEKVVVWDGLAESRAIIIGLPADGTCV